MKKSLNKLIVGLGIASLVILGQCDKTKATLNKVLDETGKGYTELKLQDNKDLYTKYESLTLKQKDILLSLRNPLSSLDLHGQADITDPIFQIMWEIIQEQGRGENIRSIWISGTNINKLPDNLFDIIPNVQVVWIRGPITMNAEKLGNCHKIRRIKLHDINFSNFPKDLSKLIDLQDLEIVDTNIEEIPVGLGNTTNLYNIDFSESNIKEIPVEVIQNPTIRNIIIRGTNIEFDSLIENLKKQGEVSYFRKDYDNSITTSETTTKKGQKRKELVIAYINNGDHYTIRLIRSID